MHYLIKIYTFVKVSHNLTVTKQAEYDLVRDRPVQVREVVNATEISELDDNTLKSSYATSKVSSINEDDSRCYVSQAEVLQMANTERSQKTLRLIVDVLTYFLMALFTADVFV